VKRNSIAFSLTLSQNEAPINLTRQHYVATMLAMRRLNTENIDGMTAQQRKPIHLRPFQLSIPRTPKVKLGNSQIHSLPPPPSPFKKPDEPSSLQQLFKLRSRLLSSISGRPIAGSVKRRIAKAEHKLTSIGCLVASKHDPLESMEAFPTNVCGKGPWKNGHSNIAARLQRTRIAKTEVAEMSSEKIPSSDWSDDFTIIEDYEVTDWEQV
jgi:hypothetical protein